MRDEKLAPDRTPPKAPTARGENIPRTARRAREGFSSGPNGPAQRCSGPAGRPGRSGVRKCSRVVELRTASDVRAAMIHAGHVGLVPNRHVTINLEAAGICNPVKSIGWLMKRMSDGCRRRGLAMSYVWVREVGSVVGEHVHILLHLPPSLGTWFARRKAGWLKQLGAKRRRGVSVTRSIRGAPLREGVSVASPELLRENIGALTSYVLKHCSDDVQRHLGIVSAGDNLLVGKRVSISQNLHRKAREGCSRCRSAAVTTES